MGNSSSREATTTTVIEPPLAVSESPNVSPKSHHCHGVNLEGRLVSFLASLITEDESTFIVAPGTKFYLFQDSIIVSMTCGFRMTEDDLIKLNEDRIKVALEKEFPGKCFTANSQQGEPLTSLSREEETKDISLCILIPDGVTDISRNDIITVLTNHLAPDYKLKGIPVTDYYKGVLGSDRIITLERDPNEDNKVYVPEGKLCSFKTYDGEHQYKFKIAGNDYLVFAKRPNVYTVARDNDHFILNAVSATLYVSLYYYSADIPVHNGSPFSREVILTWLHQEYGSYAFDNIDVAIVVFPNAVSYYELNTTLISATINIQNSALTPNSVANEIQEFFVEHAPGERQYRVLPVSTINP